MTEEEKPRLPPGQHLTDEFPVLHVGPVPRFDPTTWELRIEGEVREPKRLTYQELRALPSMIDVSDFHCVTTWSMFDAAWEGVRFSDLADLAGPTERARFVTIGCDGGPSTLRQAQSRPSQDQGHPERSRGATGSGSPAASQQWPPRAQPRGGYTTSLPIDDMMRPDVVLAWGMNGKDLSAEHGFPLRLIVPHKYAYKAAKWVRWIRFTYEQELGYWEQRGYSDSANPWREERHALCLDPDYA